MKGLSCIIFTYCVSHDHSEVMQQERGHVRSPPHPHTHGTRSVACGAGKNVTATLQSSPDGAAIRHLCVPVQRNDDGGWDDGGGGERGLCCCLIMKNLQRSRENGLLFDCEAFHQTSAGRR